MGKGVKCANFLKGAWGTFGHLFITNSNSVQMKNSTITFCTFLLFYAGLYAQVDIQPMSIGINTSGHNSELSINDPGHLNYTAYVQSNDDISGSVAVYAKAFDITSFGGQTRAIMGDADNDISSSYSTGVEGRSIRLNPSSSGRSYGVQGKAGNATDGANYGVFGLLTGSNNGSAIVGYDNVSYPGWSQVLPNNISYAGYFRGMGYFHNNLGVGAEEPQARVHVSGGDVYVDDPASGVILNSGSGCYRITVDGSGTLITTAIACP